MISIRDADKQKLEQAAEWLEGGLTISPLVAIYSVLRSIDELSQQAPVIEPRIAPMSEADKRICYPERYV